MRRETSKDTKSRSGTKDVDGYIAALSEDVRVTLEKLRQTIKAAAPMAEEVISYQIPAYKYHGPLVFFAAFKNHCSLYVPGRSALERFESELKPYDISGATVRFSPDNPLPAALVTKIVRARIEENRLRAEQKRK
jgi:uncharacterized protein YdhG (YjbR/CyaY superfamily)